MTEDNLSTQKGNPSEQEHIFQGAALSVNFDHTTQKSPEFYWWHKKQNVDIICL